MWRPMRLSSHLLVSSALLVPSVALAQQVPTSPPVGFVNSSSPNPGTIMPRLMDSYITLMMNNPAVMTQNYQTVVTMTQNRTAAQTLNAIHDDRTAQPYSILNGLGPLTSLYLTGAGASDSGVTPQSLTPTSYAPFALSNYTTNINYLNNANAGATTFGNGTATPLASAVDFINNVVRANSSTEPAKRTFERYQGANPAINPLDPRYANYNATTNKTGLTTADTAGFVVPSYLANFAVPSPYASVSDWVKGFTVTPAMIAANGGNPITAPNVGTFDAAGNFTPTLFSAGDYVPGIGTAPRPYRVSTDVSIPAPLYQVINSTNPYADGAMPSGHTNSAYLQTLGVAFLVPQQGQELLTRASDLGNNRILAGMHSPFDVIGGRIEATAIAATNIYGALYDASGNRLDWTNPANASAYSVYQAYTQTQTYLAAACNAVSVSACIAQAQAAGYGATDPYGDAATNKANYTARLTYGFQPIGPVAPLTASQVPVQAQVLLLTRFPYLTDAQRTEVLATTGLPSGTPLLSDNTYDGWGQLNLYAAWDGYGAFNGQVSVNLDASKGGYNAADAWNNDITGSGGLTKAGTGQLTLGGQNSYTGPTIVDGGILSVTGSIVSPTTVNKSGTLAGTGRTGDVTINAGGTLMPGTLQSPGTLTIQGNLVLATASSYLVQVTPTTAGRSNVTGTATLAPQSSATLSIASGNYTPGTSYTVLSANALSGSFGSVAVTGGSIPVNVTLRLTYDAQSVTLRFDQAQLPGLPAGATGNAAQIAAALNRAAAGSAVFPSAFQALYQLSPAGLSATLNQLGSQTSAAFGASANRAMTGFLSSVLDFGAPGRADGAPLGTAAPLAYTASSALAPSIASAYASATRDPMAVKAPPLPEATRWTSWTSVFAGREDIRGDATTGSQNQSSQIYGGIGGLDYRLSASTILGAAISGGQTQFSLDNGYGSGRSDFFQGAVFARHTIGDYYLAETVSGGIHDVHSSRTAAIAGVVDPLQASFSAPTLAARIEAGRRFGFAQFGLTPYAALQMQTLFMPDYTESSAQGAGLAVTTSAQQSTSTRTELGSWIDSRFALGNGDAVLRGRVAWVHSTDPYSTATQAFAALPGASFTINGAARPADTALVSGVVEVPLARRLAGSLKLDGEFGNGLTTLAATASMRYAW